MILKEIIEDSQSLSKLSRDELTELLKLLDAFIKQHPSRIHPGRDYSIFFPKELDEIIPRFSSRLEKSFKSWLDGTIKRLSAVRYKSLPILKQLDFEAIEVVEFEKLRDDLNEIILAEIKESAEAGNLKAIANIKLVSEREGLITQVS